MYNHTWEKKYFGEDYLFVFVFFKRYFVFVLFFDYIYTTIVMTCVTLIYILK